MRLELLPVDLNDRLAAEAGVACEEKANLDLERSVLAREVPLLWLPLAVSIGIGLVALSMPRHGLKGILPRFTACRNIEDKHRGTDHRSLGARFNEEGLGRNLQCGNKRPPRRGAGFVRRRGEGSGEF